jgi:hypothetical protein
MDGNIFVQTRVGKMATLADALGDEAAAAHETYENAHGLDLVHMLPFFEFSKS